MESNNNDNYVLVLEDHTEVKNEQEAGKLSVVSSIDDKGNLKTTEAIGTTVRFIRVLKLNVYFQTMLHWSYWYIWHTVIPRQKWMMMLL